MLAVHAAAEVVAGEAFQAGVAQLGLACLIGTDLLEK